MKVRIFSSVPGSLRSKGNEQCGYHVHTADCRDCNRYGGSDGGHAIEFESKTQIADYMYEDIMAEEENPESGEYLYDFHFAPCCDGLPTEVAS